MELSKPMKHKSKPLEHDDSSGFEFVKEILQGDPTYAINFDRLQKHPLHGYIIFEFLLCEAHQTVTPYSSHPNRYWHRNSRKFISLFQVAKDLHATLFLVNYAKKATQHEQEILLIQVEEIDVSKGITKQKLFKTNRLQFSQWFRKLNQACAGSVEALEHSLVSDSLGVEWQIEGKFFKLAGVWLCFEQYEASMKDEIIKQQPQKVIFFDACFASQDEYELLKQEISETTIHLLKI
jgi:hypothetical protein